MRTAQEMQTIIQANNNTHHITTKELAPLLAQAKKIPISNDVYFERSIFINWTCGIADCKYCFLSTQPKKKLNATRKPASVLAEALLCKLLGWKVGYLTGGLRVESTDYLKTLVENVGKVLGEKTMMNFGPYSKSEVKTLAPYVKGMGSAIESFDEELHNYICPSKPLKQLKNFLDYLQEEELDKLITIILGIGEKKTDVEEVIKYVEEYEINAVQLCFLKPQENTVFDKVPAPDPNYMAWWIATLRIACPKLQIKVALVRERTQDLALYLEAGANNFSRFIAFKDFKSDYAQQIVEGCAKAGRTLKGHFTTLPNINLEEEVRKLPLEETLQEKILIIAKSYWKDLEKK